MSTFRTETRFAWALDLSFTTDPLAQQIVNSSQEELLEKRKIWAVRGIDTYDTSSPLARYVADGRATYWLSNSESSMETVVFEPYHWIHVKYPWDATVVYLTRKSHAELLQLYHADEDDDLAFYPYLTNRIEGANVFTNKVNFVTTLASYFLEGRAGRSASYIQTPSYVIHSAADCEAFLQNQWIIDNRTWVHKLAAESQGIGIAFFSPLQPSRLPCSPTDGSREPFVLQAHIDYPLLFSGKKSEMRAYWAIVSVDPLIVVLYNRGTVRLATKNYTGWNNWENPLVHVLNTRQQKDANPNYEQTAEERKRSWTALPQKLRREGRIPQSQSDEEWIDRVLLPVINETIYTVVRAAQGDLQSKEHNPLGMENRRFELFGLDIILEDTTARLADKGTNNLGEGGSVIEPGGLRAWVTEAQVGPGLSLDSKTKLEVSTAMT